MFNHRVSPAIFLLMYRPVQEQRHYGASYHRVRPKYNGFAAKEPAYEITAAL